MTIMIAGETPGWEKLNVYLDGEYLYGCAVANDTEGWALVDKGTVTDGKWRPDTCICATCGYRHTPSLKLFGKVEFRDA